MPTVPVKNYTRYNTQDLENIVERVEAYIRAASGLPVPNCRVQNFEFNNYTQGAPKGRRSRYSRNNGLATQKAYLGKTSYRHQNRVSLVQPQYAFESELEWLTVAASEAPQAPAAMVAQIANFMVDRYSIPWSNTRLPFDSTGLTLRIEGKVTATKTADDRRADRLQKASTRLMGAKYSLRQVGDRCNSSLKVVKVAIKHLGKEGQDLQDAVERLEALMMEADSLRDLFMRRADAIKREMGENDA